ncbi:DUF2510 domain-containing protein [Subtercola endophyticus]|uniref:DUF2510 domain-containing protein n=1 Tax=Subtercola endophyticus TaxID=2895559 RepID=UPI001E64D96E|nr:DUF2510 domain-containing protein [Subtercola endophyticus]UFS57630.1 DUF2510 domain-containing protein [Subtercola endophyticus]
MSDEQTQVAAGWYPLPEDPTSEKLWDGGQWVGESRPRAISNLTPTHTPAAPLPAAGFYPDPDQPGQERYWNGQTWSPASSGATSQTGIALDPRIDNKPASRSVLFGAISILINPFGALSIVAIILAIVGFTRVPRIQRFTGQPTGRKSATAGLILGVVGAIVFFSVALPLIGSLLNPTLDGRSVEQTITSQASDKGVTFTSVQCPSSPSAASGTSFECVAMTSDSQVMIRVSVIDNSYAWQAEQ